VAVNKCLRTTFHCSTQTKPASWRRLLYFIAISRQTSLERCHKRDRDRTEGRNHLPIHLLRPLKTCTSPLRTTSRRHFSSIIVLNRRHRLQTRLPRVQQIDITNTAGKKLKRNSAGVIIFGRFLVLISTTSYIDFGVTGFLITPPHY
jgi:hypothetical protein